MKLKKILASLTAAALAVTTMAFAPVSVSATTLNGSDLSYDLIVKVGSSWTEYYAGSENMAADGSDDRSVTWSAFADSSSNPLDTNSSDPMMQYIARIYYYDGDGSIGLDNFIVPISYSAKKGDTEIIDTTSTVSFAKISDTTYQGELYLSANDTEFTHWDNSLQGNVAGITISSFSSSYSSLSASIAVDIANAIPVTKDNALLDNLNALFGSTPDDDEDNAYSMELAKYVSNPNKVASMMAVFTQKQNSYSYMNGRIVDITEGTVFTNWYMENNEYIAAKADITNESTGGTVKIVFDYVKPESDGCENKLCYVEFYDADGKKLAHVDSTFTELKPCRSIELDKTELELVVGGKETLTAKTTPADTTDPVNWESSDENVATVDENGIVTAVAEGKATITAAANDNVSAECEVTVISKKKITVTVNNEAYGTASADKPEAAEGETVKLTATPNTGCKFVEWQSDEVTVTNNAFTMPAEEVTVTAVFAEKEADEFDIVVLENNYGSVVVEGGLTAAKAGDEINLIVTPIEGLELDYISVNEKIIEGTSFVMPAEDVTISAIFTASTYTIELEVSKGGTASADRTTAIMGETVTITAVPDDGYDLSYIKVNGTKISGTSFTMPAENVKVVVAFYKLVECNISMPEDVSVDVGLVSSNEEVFAAIFGNDYEGLTENHTLSVELHVGGESVVSAEDKALVEAALTPNQKVGLYLDLSLYKKIDDKTEIVTKTIEPISLSIGVPDSIIADGRTYSVMRVHDGKAENIGGTFDSVKKSLLVSSNLFSTYAIVYEDSSKPQVKPAAQSEPVPVVYYSIAADRNVTVSTSSAPEGTVIDVKAAFGYDAYVYCGSQRLMKFTGRGSFVMPAGNVTIVSEENGYLAMIRNAAPNSYIFVYDADMNYIKTNGSVKGIAGEGKITVKLGEEYAGKTVTLYKGRKSTSVKLDSKTLDENGNATFTVEGGKNYTAVVE
ncbi:InlB B-repeat-containing protein [Huintestinicola sp.]|uniref:InlB B-repeat-containing protein n=1 Tax=Huintestinicola sp. TaxID=2981661 RepID=UPI003D7CD399